MTLLLGLVTWTVVGRALRPVESIRAEVADISDSNLSRRVPEPPGGDEIAQLAKTMNAMLDRLEAAQRRQQAFASDASHELQSPLTRLRTAPRGGDPPGHDRLGSPGRPVVGRRRDGAAGSGPAVPRTRRRAAGRGIPTPSSSISTTWCSRRLRGSGSGAGCRSRRRECRRHRSVAAGSSSSGWCATCSRTRSGMPDASRGPRGRRPHGRGSSCRSPTTGRVCRPEHRTRVFERFVRLDDDRSREAGGGSGLGLSIVATIAWRHGGTCTVTDSGRGARFVLRLPTVVD